MLHNDQGFTSGYHFYTEDGGGADMEGGEGWGRRGRRVSKKLSFLTPDYPVPISLTPKHLTLDLVSM